MKSEIQEVLNEYMKERGRVPDFAKILAEENPEFLINWFNTSRTYAKGVLPEKFKEILQAVCNSIRLSESGVRTHIQLAIKMGATKQEIVEAALCSAFIIGGFPSLILCLRTLMSVLAEEAKT